MAPAYLRKQNKVKPTPKQPAKKTQPVQSLPKVGKFPENWPAEVTYLNSPTYSKYVTPAQLAIIRTPPPPQSPSTSSLSPVPGEGDIIPVDFPTGPNPSVHIARITDPLHPATGQWGLYAARDLQPGELIVPYYGVVYVGSWATAGSDSDPVTAGLSALSLESKETREAKADEPEDAEKQKERLQHENSDYDLWLSREANLAVDSELSGNEARFINDYRGVDGRDRANAEFRAVWDPRVGEYTMAVYVLPLGKKAREKMEKAQEEKIKRLMAKQKRDGKNAGGVLAVSSVGVIKKGEEILVSYGRGFWERRKEDPKPAAV